MVYKDCRLDGCTFNISQENDSNDPGSLGQYLTIEVTDNGAGKYLLLKSDRWAIEPTDIDAFCAMLKKMLILAEEK